MPTILQVPYSEKDLAKSLGARWDVSMTSWYVPDGVDLRAFESGLSAVLCCQAI